jgi:hypothetical protein
MEGIMNEIFKGVEIQTGILIIIFEKENGRKRRCGLQIDDIKTRDELVARLHVFAEYIKHENSRLPNAETCYIMGTWGNDEL